MAHRAGFTLIELLLVLSIIGVLALIATPQFSSMRGKAYDASARSAGRHVKFAEELYFQEYRNYTENIEDLLEMDRNLNDHKEINFIWSYAGDSYYTFTTHHTRGTRTFVFHD